MVQIVDESIFCQDEQLQLLGGCLIISLSGKELHSLTWPNRIAYHSLCNFAAILLPMGKRVLLLAVLVSQLPGSPQLFAQGSRNGPKVGGGIGTQTFGKFLQWNGQPKLGPVAGWSFEAPVTEQVSLLIEPMYIGKGSVTVDNVQKTRTSVALNYLELPLLIKVSTNPDPQGLYLSGGLMYGYLLHGKVKNFQYGELKSEYTFSPSTNQNRGQWSAGVGLGQEVGPWLIELRGQSSLNTFDRLVRSHNVVYSVQVAWRFPTQAEKDRKRAEREEQED